MGIDLGLPSQRGRQISLGAPRRASSSTLGGFDLGDQLLGAVGCSLQLIAYLPTELTVCSIWSTTPWISWINSSKLAMPSSPGATD
jgi:hypothetical protein